MLVRRHLAGRTLHAYLPRRNLNGQQDPVKSPSEGNVRKQGAVHDSLMNDDEMHDATVLTIQEPQARRIQGRLLTTPIAHHKWTKMVPSTWREGRWAIRSMLWVSKDAEAEQVPIQSPDMTAAVIHLPGRPVLVLSVYVLPVDSKALRDTCDICLVRQGEAADMIVEIQTRGCEG